MRRFHATVLTIALVTGISVVSLTDHASAATTYTITPLPTSRLRPGAGSRSSAGQPAW
jgi:hypothetical protein